MESKLPKTLGEPVFPWNKTSETRKCNRAGPREKWEWPIARCLGHVGPTHSHLVAPMSSIFISCWMHLDLKPSIKRVPLRGVKRCTTKTRKHETEAWEIKDWRGKLWRGAAGSIPIPSNNSTFVAMMKGE
jgi:hypothetical protein